MQSLVWLHEDKQLSDCSNIRRQWYAVLMQSLVWLQEDKQLSDCSNI